MAGGRRGRRPQRRWSDGVTRFSAPTRSAPDPGGGWLLCGTRAEVHDEVAGLLGGPRPVGVRGDAQDVQVAVADLEDEKDLEPPKCHRAVDVEEVDREHAGGLRAPELPPAGVG